MNNTELKAFVFGVLDIDGIIGRDTALKILNALESAERERDELSGKYQEVSGWYAKMKTRMLSAEEELARRDAAAREPVGWQFLDERGRWLTVTEAGKDTAVSQGYSVRPIHTAAQPAVLPPEKPVHTDLSRTDIMKNIAYNQALNDVKELGAQPRSPSPSQGVMTLPK